MVHTESPEADVLHQIMGLPSLPVIIPEGRGLSRWFAAFSVRLQPDFGLGPGCPTLWDP